MTILFAAFLLGLVFNATPGAVFAETVRRGASDVLARQGDLELANAMRNAKPIQQP